MNNELKEFDLKKLKIDKLDPVTRKFLMIIEGTYTIGPKESFEKYGYTEQRYYQLLKDFRKLGVDGLLNQKRGPHTNSVRTEPVINRIIRHRFLDPKSSSQVIAQKLKQEGFSVSTRSVERTIQQYGLQKKTLQIKANRSKKDQP